MINALIAVVLAAATTGQVYNPLGSGIAVTAKLDSGRSQRIAIGPKSSKPLPTGATSIMAFMEMIGRDSKRTCSTPWTNTKDTDRWTITWGKRDNKCSFRRQ